MYLVDTNVISEARKKSKANPGVKSFFKTVAKEESRLFISVITIGEIRCGIDQIKHRGDIRQANLLEKWLNSLLEDYNEYLLDIDTDIAQLWGRLRVPRFENALDKLIAATALINGLTVVTRNTKDFIATGVPILNPFE